MHQLKLKGVIFAPLVAKNRIGKIMDTYHPVLCCKVDFTDNSSIIFRLQILMYLM